MHDTNQAIHLLSQVFILGFSDWFLCDDRRVDVSLQIRNEFLNFESIFDYFALALISLDPDLLHGVRHFLQIFNKIIVLCFKVLICFVNDVDEYFPVILQGSS